MPDSACTRHKGIDAARALGMLLVYYGHYVEQLMYLGNGAAAAQYKCIYSFHMIFFFVVSGWTGGLRAPRGPFPAFVRYRFLSRIVPYLVFSAVLAVLAQFIPGWYPLADVRTGAGFMQAMVSTLMGFPLFNIPLWFLGALVSVECCHFWMMRLGSLRRTGLAAVIMLIIGLAVNSRIFFLEQGLMFWLVNEVPVAWAFYFLGVVLAQGGVLDRFSRPALLATVLGTGLVVLLTYNLNEGPFRIIQAVVILLGSHGQPVLFVCTALAGSFLLLALGQLLAGSRILGTIGRNSLTALAMNGVFYHFMNKPLAAWVAENLPAAGWSVFLGASCVTVVSLGLCLPVFALANHWLPQLIGRPCEQGPVIPSLC